VRRVVVGLVVAGALAGCDASPPTPAPRSPAEACRLAIDRRLACAPQEESVDLRELRELYVDHCEGDRFRRVEDDVETLACLELRGCDEFMACVQRIEERVGLRPMMVEINRAVRARQPRGDRLEVCFANASRDAELAGLCEELYALAVAEMRGEIERLRDTGASAGEHCTQLEATTGKISEEARETVRVLCEEVSAGVELGAALREVELLRSFGGGQIPGACASTLERLDRLATPWARGKRGELVQKCYVELGAMLLPGLVKRKACEEVAEVYEHLSPRAAADPALAKTLAKAERACPVVKGAE
jgi:hypothetical protein